jgi:hypothetical protein
MFVECGEETGALRHESAGGFGECVGFAMRNYVAAGNLPGLAYV